jgi:hypothetical protein
MPDRHAPAPARDCPDAPETAGPDGHGLGPLDAADAAFRALVTGPRPLALNPARLAPGMPDRQVPLDELKALLLHPATSGTARNKVWAELVRRACSGQQPVDSSTSTGTRFRSSKATALPRDRAAIRPAVSEWQRAAARSWLTGPLD